jgi:hypothetical protein
MKTLTHSVAAAALIAFALGLAAPAQAQLARTFVSAASGNDGNSCDRATPCRTFQAAHDKRLPAGEITVLDPGGYGTVTITKAISIINDGVGEAGALISGGNAGVTIAAGASDAVSLRGLTIKGIGFGGGNGIVFLAGKSLTVENCVVRNLSGATVNEGILFFPVTASTLSVSNTLVADNAGDGIAIQPRGSGPARAVLTRVEAYNNAVRGLIVVDNTTATVTDSVFAGNHDGILAFSQVQAQAAVTVAGTTIANNQGNNEGVGIIAAGNAIVRLGQSTVTGNDIGWVVKSGGVLRSYGDNQIDGNGDGDTAPPTIAKR